MDPRKVRYEEVAVIGNGAYGTVFKARDLENEGNFVAMKRINIPRTEDGMPMSTVREISLLRQIENFEHPNIVRMFDIIIHKSLDNQKALTLVFEHVDQDLARYIERCPSPGLGPDRIKDLMKQLLLGVEFLHTHRIIHRDLKPSNILVTSKGELKLADFGLSRVYAFQMALTSVVVTLWYRAPEVLLTGQYATPIDLWSCGCIFAEMCNRKPLFRGNSESDQLHKIFEIMGLPEENKWPVDVSFSRSSFHPSEHLPLEIVVSEMDNTGHNLLNKLLEFQPDERINAKEALVHPYFSDDDLRFMSISNGSSQSSDISSSESTRSPSSMSRSASSMSRSASSMSRSSPSSMSRSPRSSLSANESSDQFDHFD